MLISQAQYKYPKISVVVVNWNAWAITELCLESIKTLNYPNYEVIIVDNGSTTPAPNYFREKYLTCELLETGENLGYTGGNNAGIRSALSRHADYVLILNNDAVIVDPDMLNKLVICFLAIPTTAIVAPRLLEYRPNGVFIGSSYTASRLLQLLISIVTNKPFAALSKGMDFNFKTLEGIGCQAEAMSAAFVSGSVMLISRQVFELIGFLDEQLFMYDDETDFCLRVLEAGLEILYVQNTSVARVTCTIEDMPAYRAYLQGRNRFRLAHKRKTWLHSTVFVIFHIASSLRTMIVLIRCRRWKEAASILNGLWDGVVGRWGMTPKLRKLLAGTCQPHSHVLGTPGDSFR